MRCDTLTLTSLVLGIVSIHTPTWGVTCISPLFNKYHYVSIHTPTWGVTQSDKPFYIHSKWFQSTHLHEVWLLGQRPRPFRCRFNPHTYMRCDPFGFLLFLTLKVSIHTPTWGVTFWIFAISDTKSFNPHTYMRCDLLDFCYFWH